MACRKSYPSCELIWTLDSLSNFTATKLFPVTLLSKYLRTLLAFKMVYTLTVHLYANDKPDSIERIKAKLIEAARVYRKDKETVDWLVMQDVHDPRAFTIVERFEQESVRVPL